ncbi:hypothetical protein RCL1_001095 [Eukaryota sp. TZLM3-RCL]
MTPQNSPLYRLIAVIGEGSFGVVYQGYDYRNRLVAIKRTPKLGTAISREVSVLRSLRHPNIIHIRDLFYSFTESNEEDADNDTKRKVFQNIVMDYIPSNIYSIITSDQFLSNDWIMTISFQLLLALSHMYLNNVVHRDLTPKNVLYNPQTKEIKVCDFGSAKVIVNSSKESSTCYICTRHYRAPELLLGSTTYNTAVDTYAAGLLIAECFLRKPVFPGNSTVEQLKLILSALRPTKNDMIKLCPELKKVNISFEGNCIDNLLNSIPETPRNLILKMISFSPEKRPTPFDCLKHPWFSPIYGRDCVNFLPKYFKNGVDFDHQMRPNLWIRKCSNK